MALALNLSVVERNDGKLITFTDTSTGWGTDGDPDVTDLVARSSNVYSITMNITVNTPTAVIVCDQIDLYGIAGPFLTQSDLVFELNYNDILSNGQGIDNDQILPDGIWDITYKVQHYSGGEWLDIDVRTFSVLVYGDVRIKVYNRLRQVAQGLVYDNCTSRSIQESLLYYTLLKSIEKSAFVARKEELLSMLETLERLLLNGSNYPW